MGAASDVPLLVLHRPHQETPAITLLSPDLDPVPTTPPCMDVGERVRQARQLKRFTLRTVAKRAGLSESFLSQVERGKANPSIVSLQRIAAALGMSIGDLFDAEGSVPVSRVLRKADRPGLAMGELGRKFQLTSPSFQHLEVFVGELDPCGSTGDEQYVHGDSEELFVVLSGAVDLHLGADVHRLAAGDSIDYRSSTPHRTVNTGTEAAEVMWIMSPASY
jgi:transcriptional regulator with XRE-family HTH domain